MIKAASPFFSSQKLMRIVGLLRHCSYYSRSIAAFLNIPLCNQKRLFTLGIILTTFPVITYSVPTNIFPIEVMSTNNEQVVGSFRFELDDPNRVDEIAIQCHRCGFYSPAMAQGSTEYNKSSKVSIRANDGPWIDVNNQNVSVAEKDNDYGGINGGFYTNQFSIVRANTEIPLRVGINSLQFRFNGTDGISNGFRILDVKVLSEGLSVLDAEHYSTENPINWEPIFATSQDINRGKNLWFSANIVDNPVRNRNLNTSCADCHANSGQDLKYFNYSNKSIITRSQFHGLTYKQGAMIASYIRSLPIPYASQARPWNPPYQPGKNIDARPVRLWAAGSGLNSVLPNDADIKNLLFPNGTSETSIRNVINRNKKLNTRELPISIQLPDWNAWLPEIHPKQFWLQNWDGGIDKWSPRNAYETIVSELSSKRSFYLSRPTEMVNLLSSLDAQVRGFISYGNTDNSNGGSPWRSFNSAAINQAFNNYSSRLNAIPQNQLRQVTRELSKLNLAKWSAVKHWEINRRFNLEEISTQLFGEVRGEKRAWTTRGQNVHPLAPHIVADNLLNLAYQRPLVGVYQSSSWYQLQMVLNSGQRQAVNVTPQDWPYQYNHIIKLGNLSGRHEPLRFIASFLKGLQQRDNGEGPGLLGWQLRITHPWWLYSTPEGDTSHMDALNTVESGLENKVVAAFINTLQDIQESFLLNDWIICNDQQRDISNWFCVPEENHVPAAFVSGRKYFKIPDDQNHADNYYRIIPCLAEQGVNPSQIQRLIDWADRMWPDNINDRDWHGVKTLTCTAP